MSTGRATRTARDGPSTPPPYPRADVDWGAAQEMTSVEATLWRSGSDPRLRAPGLFLDVLDEVPDFGRLQAAHRWALERVPRLAQRVVDDPLRLGPPAWVSADVDLDHHLRRETLPPGSTLADALAVAADLHASTLDRTRPLWRATLIDGLPDGQAAYLLKLHHAIADGEAFIELFELVHSDRRAPTPDKPRARTRAHPPVSGAGLARRHAARLLEGAPGAVTGTARAATRTAVRTARRPVASTVSSARWAASLRRVTTQPTPSSPLLARRGLRRVLLALDVPEDALAAAGRAGGGTVDDAFLTALAAGLRRFHAEHGIAIRDLPVGVPVSLRGEDELGGSHVATARISLPLDEADPRHAMQVIRWRVLEARHEPALDVLGLAAPVVGRMPAAALTRIANHATESVDVQAQTMRGLERSAYIAGARVLRMYPFAPVPGCAVVASLVMHERTCCIGVSVDAKAIPDTADLERCLRAGLDDVLALRDDLVGVS